MNKKENLIVLAPAWPDDYSGYGIALKSSLEFYTTKYKVIHYIIIGHTNKSDKFLDNDVVKYEYIHIPKASNIVNLIYGILKNIPIFVSMYYNKQAEIKLKNLLDRIMINTKNNYDLCVEDLALNYYKEIIIFNKSIKHFVRSHNIMYEVLDGMIGISHFFDLFIKYEKKKIYKFEKKVISSCDCFFSISERDKSEYISLYNLKIDGVIDIFIENPTIVGSSNEINNNLINFGNANLWKSHGIKDFIENIFLKLKESYPDVNFYLAGKGTEKFNNIANNIYGLGFVNTDDEIYQKGTYFVNPQLSGSGIKIKTINAILNKKLLVSTKKGTEGIPLVKDLHYIEFNDLDSFIKGYEKCTKNHLKAKQMIEDSYTIIKNFYSKVEFLNRSNKDFGIK